MTDLYLVHTTSPLGALRHVVGDEVTIEQGLAARGGADCFYGWTEQQKPTGGCRAHMIVKVDVELDARWIASTLKSLGHQVVVTEIDAVCDEVEMPGMPRLYDDHHNH